MTAQESLNPVLKNALLKLAREAIVHYLKAGKTLKKKINDDILKEKRGAFVTIKVNGKLRGCIGYPLPHKPLFETIIDCAQSAASKDYRFRPLSLEELPDTEIEISVLSLPKPIKNISEIKIGEHGIIIKEGKHKGLLLPQVPVEWNWDLETYLRHGCLKAGLDENAWKEAAKIEVFSAQVFSEDQKQKDAK
jgi:AmmeMemoRadiSam system protein A